MATAKSALKRLILGLVLAGMGVTAVQAKSLEFHLHNDTFARNIEHTKIDNINEGQTFIGNITKPFFRYRIKRGMMIDAGALLSIPFGEDDRVETVDPVISFLYEFHPGFRVTAGTIDRNHPLLDAIFNNDILQYTNPIEQGFQFQTRKKYFQSDTWIDWEERELTNRREKFNVGNSIHFEYNGLMLDSQVYWVHFGGQRNAGGGADNNLSWVWGGGYKVHPNKWVDDWTSFEELGITSHFVKVKDEPSGNQPDSEDQGFVTKIFARIWGTDLHFLFWEGGSQTFLTDRGDPLYKAGNFQEFGVQKTIWVADDINITFGVKAQFVQDKFVHEDLVTVKWAPSFPVLSDYFKNLSSKERQAKRRSSKRIARRPRNK